MDDHFHDNSICPAVPSVESVAYLQHMNIQLPCQCKPAHSSVVWYYKEKMEGPATKVLTEPKVTKSQFLLESKVHIVENNLIIHKAQTTDAGIYMCGSSKGQFFYGYDVDIQNTKKANVVFLEARQRPQPDRKTKYYKAFTGFWRWGMCDRCGVRGEQTRVGLCYVRSSYLDLMYEVASGGEAPCGSAAVPAELEQTLASRGPEILIRSCSRSCTTHMGLIGTIVNTAIKLKEYIPFFKTPVEKHTHTLGSALTIACPGAKPTDAVAWDKGGRELYRSNYLIGQKKSKRIYIDFANHLNFRYVSFSDQATYYCWLNGQKKAGLELAIRTDPETKRKCGRCLPPFIYTFFRGNYRSRIYEYITVIVSVDTCVHIPPTQQYWG
ncbi:Ig-like V-type domain-containing protein FAM187A [Gastrophryne carolinensis]